MQQSLLYRCVWLTAAHRGLRVRRYLEEPRLLCRLELRYCRVALRDKRKLELAELAVSSFLPEPPLVESDRPPLMFCRLPCGSPVFMSQAVFSSSPAAREHQPARTTLRSVVANIVDNGKGVGSPVVAFRVQSQEI